MKMIKTNSSKLDIFLVNMPPWSLENPPLGVSYLASYLESKGMKPFVFDFNLYLFNHIDPEYHILWHLENKNLWKDPRAFKILLKIIKKELKFLVNLLASSNAKVLGFSTADPREALIIEVIKRIKKVDQKKKVVVGGPGCLTKETRHPFIDNIPHLIDALVVGEGERPLFELLEKIKARKSFKKIDGVIAQKQGQLEEHDISLSFENINHIPFPTYKDLHINHYAEKSVAVVWSRGCVGNCSFCKEKALWGKHRQRKAKNIVEEIDFHVKENGITKFFVWDSALNGNPEELEKTCDLIIQGNYAISWSGMAIPHKRMTARLCKKLKKAGCTRLIYGVENGSNKVLKLMRKIFQSKDAEFALKNTHKAGITTSINILLGFPGEEEEDFQETLNFVTRNRNNIDLIDSLSITQVLDGTPLYMNASKYGIDLNVDNWYTHWIADKGNTIELRMSRAKKFLREMKKKGIKVKQANTLFQDKGPNISGVNKFRKEMGRIHIT
jgi:radical SAM superfamily enzyme YgiQ (UPF0313 family)